MDRRKRILVGPYEVATDAALSAVAEKYGGRLFSKVRIADALDIDGSGLSDDAYHYALRAHFDFVVADSESRSLFAVEYDGRHHDTDPRTIVRDGLKRVICAQLGLPLLRIDSAFFRRLGRFVLLGWLAEVWFLRAAFDAAQAAGEIEPYEIFNYSAILGFAYRDGSRLVSIDHLPVEEQTHLVEKHQGRMVITRPYDPFLSSRAIIMRSYEEGQCRAPFPEEVVGADPRGYVVALGILPVADDRFILGFARVRAYDFPAVPPYELAIELSVVDAAEKLKRYRWGKYRGVSLAEVDRWRERVKRWRAYR